VQHSEIMNTYDHKLTEPALGAAHLQHGLVKSPGSCD